MAEEKKSDTPASSEGFDPADENTEKRRRRIAELGARVQSHRGGKGPPPEGNTTS